MYDVREKEGAHGGTIGKEDWAFNRIGRYCKRTMASSIIKEEISGMRASQRFGQRETKR